MPLVARARGGGASRLLNTLPPLALGVAVLLIWQAITQARVVSTFLLPTPAEVARTFWSALVDGSRLPTEALVTLEESLGGFVIGTLTGIPVGYGIARSPLLARTFQPYLAASQAVPAVALAPLLVLWLPFGLPPVIALCALIIFFPIVVNTALGIRGLDRDVLDAARVEGAGRWARLRSIEFPLALPSILAGLRTSLTLSITGAVVGEFVVGGVGLGGSLVTAQANNDPPLVFATLLMLGILAATLYGVARLVERRLSYLED
ncbi:MAG: ABC transporter permease [Ktedonobacterales bacterium]|nr:ABC transporter permease [Ktedonobacterales bacterium]